MKINLIRKETITIYLERLVEIETDDFDNLKGLSLDEINTYISTDGYLVELNGDSLDDFILDGGDVVREKGNEEYEYVVESIRSEE